MSDRDEQDTLVRALARHVLGHLSPEFCTADCMATAVLTSDWLAEHDRQVRRAVAEEIAQALEREAQAARNAYRATPTDHFAHDYCRWVGHAEAGSKAARIARQIGGAD